jgi:hypothetical protein
LHVVKVVPKVNNLGFVLNEELTATDNFKKVCQKVYWILRSLKPHASHTPFEVRRRLVVSPIMIHIGYGGIVYAAAQWRLNMAFRAGLRYLHSLRRLDHVSHLALCWLIMLIMDSAFVGISFHFTRNLVVPAHRSLAMSQSLR